MAEITGGKGNGDYRTVATPPTVPRGHANKRQTVGGSGESKRYTTERSEISEDYSPLSDAEEPGWRATPEEAPATHLRSSIMTVDTEQQRRRRPCSLKSLLTVINFETLRDCMDT